LAYKSLVDNPKELMKLKPKEKLNDEESALVAGSVSTLPRLSSSNVEAQNLNQSHQKSATLSKILGRSKDNQESSSSPLKILRDRNFPIIKPRLRILPSVGSESVNSTTLLLDNDGESICESPSYLQHPQYTFSQKEIEQTENNSSKSQPNNPLPLPPRDRNSIPSAASQKRHVRKHPLIIPATGLQRTLNKVNQVTPVEEKTDIFPIPAIVKPQMGTQNSIDDEDDDVFTYDVPKPQDFRCNETNTNIMNDAFEYDVPKSHELREQLLNDNNVDQPSCSKYEKNYTKDFIENNFPISPDEAIRNTSKFTMNESILSRNSSIYDDQRTYENLEFFQNQMKDDGADTASLHFESILENDDNMIALSPIPDDMVDGFNLFNVEKERSKSPATSSPVKSSDKKIPGKINFEVKRQEFTQKFPKYKMPKNELASNALFNKIKESVEMANARRDEGKSSDDEQECDLKKSINHVSCEDLLDFSDKKPCGKERGLESDEMRILTKVLGNAVSF
jgi:hypothetical protein